MANADRSKLRLRVWVMGLAASALVATQMSSPAIAYTVACNGGGTTHMHRHAGYASTTSSATYEGAKATITSRYGFICDEDTNGNTIGGNFTSAWTMTQGNGSGAWAQAGVIRFVGNSLNHLYAEDNKSGDNEIGYRRIFGGSIAYGDQRVYWVQYVASGSYCGARLRQNYNTTIMQTSDFDPAQFCTPAWSLPWDAAYSSEVRHPSSDIDGVNGSSESFTSMQVQLYSNDTWSSSLPSMTAFLDNPSYSPINPLGSYCQARSLDCRTYALSSIASNTFNSNTSNPH